MKNNKIQNILAYLDSNYNNTAIFILIHKQTIIKKLFDIKKFIIPLFFRYKTLSITHLLRLIEDSSDSFNK